MEERSRLKKHLITYLCVLALGAVYFIWIKVTGIGIPCIFHLLTGWSCPGCGVTTLILSVVHGRFDLARDANPFLFYTWPLIAGFIIYAEVKAIKRKRYKADKIVNILMFAYIGALIVFGVVRNWGVPLHLVRMGASLH